nr:uncharacterized protein LOC128699348 [Cherax quadricarinatus]
MATLKVFTATVFTVQLLRVEATRYVWEHTRRLSSELPPHRDRRDGSSMITGVLNPHARTHGLPPRNYTGFDGSWGLSKSSGRRSTASRQARSKNVSRMQPSTRADEEGRKRKHLFSPYQKERQSVSVPGTSRLELPLVRRRNKTFRSDARADSSIDSQKSDAQHSHSSERDYSWINSPENSHLMKIRDILKIEKEHLMDEPEQNEEKVHIYNRDGKDGTNFPADDDNLRQGSVSWEGRSLGGWGGRVENHWITDSHQANTQSTAPSRTQQAQHTPADSALQFRPRKRNKNIHNCTSHLDQPESSSGSGQINAQTDSASSAQPSILTSTQESVFVSAMSKENRVTTTDSTRKKVEKGSSDAIVIPAPAKRDSGGVQVINSSMAIISTEGKWNETMMEPLSSHSAKNWSVITKSSVDNIGPNFYKTFSSTPNSESSVKIINQAIDFTEQKQRNTENRYKQPIKEVNNVTTPWVTSGHEHQPRHDFSFFKFNVTDHENSSRSDQDEIQTFPLKEIQTGRQSPTRQYLTADPSPESHLPEKPRGSDEEHMKSNIFETSEQEDRVLVKKEDNQNGEHYLKGQITDLNVGTEKTRNLGNGAVQRENVEGFVWPGVEPAGKNDREGRHFPSHDEDSFFASFERFFAEQFKAKTSSESKSERIRSNGSLSGGFEDENNEQTDEDQSWNGDFQKQDVSYVDNKFTSHQNYRRPQTNANHKQHTVPQYEAPLQSFSSSPSLIFGFKISPKYSNSFLNQSTPQSLLATSRESSLDQAPRDVQLSAASIPASVITPTPFPFYQSKKFPSSSVTPTLVLPSTPPSKVIPTHPTPYLLPLHLDDAPYNPINKEKSPVSNISEPPETLTSCFKDILSHKEQPSIDFYHFDFQKTSKAHLSKGEVAFNAFLDKGDADTEASVSYVQETASPTPISNQASLPKPLLHLTPQTTQPIVLTSPDASASYPLPALLFPPPLPPPFHPFRPLNPPTHLLPTHPHYNLFNRGKIKDSQSKNSVSLLRVKERPAQPLHESVKEDTGHYYYNQKEDTGQSLGYVDTPTTKRPSHTSKTYLQNSDNKSTNAVATLVNGRHSVHHVQHLPFVQDNMAVRANVESRRPQGNHKSRIPILYQVIKRPLKGEGNRGPHSRFRNGKRLSRPQDYHDNRRLVNTLASSSFGNTRGSIYGLDSEADTRKISQLSGPHQLPMRPPEYHLKPPPANFDNDRNKENMEIQVHKHDGNKKSLQESLLCNETKENEKCFQSSPSGGGLVGSQTTEPSQSFQYLKLSTIHPHQSRPTGHVTGPPSPPSFPSVEQYTPPPRYNSFGLLSYRPPPRRPKHHETRKSLSPPLPSPASNNKPSTYSSQTRNPRAHLPHPDRVVVNLTSPTGSRTHFRNFLPQSKSTSLGSSEGDNPRFRPGKESESDFKPMYEVSQPIPKVPNPSGSRMSESHAEMMKNMQYGVNGVPLDIWIPI